MKSGAMSRIVEPRISGNSVIRGNSKGFDNEVFLTNDRRNASKLAYTNESGDTTDD